MKRCVSRWGSSACSVRARSSASARVMYASYAGANSHATRGYALRAAYDDGMSVHADAHLDGLPGADLVLQGIADLEQGRDTIAAALTEMAAPRLCAIGLEVPRTQSGRPAGHQLYELLAADDAATAHSRYNALVARMVSFARAAERARSG